MIKKCDYNSKCKNKAFREVYPFLLKGKRRGSGWGYLCRKHYYQEQKVFKGELPSCGID